MATLTAEDNHRQRDLYKNIGTVLMQQGHSAAAIEDYERGSPAAAQAQTQALLKPVLESQGPSPSSSAAKVPLAAANSAEEQERERNGHAQLLREAQTHAALLADVWRARSVVCDWELYEPRKRQLRALVDSAELAHGKQPSLLPFDALLVDFDAAFQLRVAQQYARTFSAFDSAYHTEHAGLASGGEPAQGGAGARWAQRRQTLRRHLRRQGHPPPPALRMAFVSHDFNDHPTAHLMEGLFVHHNASAVAVSVFSYGKDDGSRYRRAIAALASRRHAGFADLSAADHPSALEAVRGGNFDVCFDAQVHTMGARPALLAARPCSLVVNYLVFPGTSGAAWHDFVVADAAVLPPEHVPAFTEKVAFAPLTYQCNYYPPSALALLIETAHERTATALLPQWPTSPWSPVFIPAETRNGATTAAAVPQLVGRKSAPILFCNFQKIDRLEPQSFALWVRILARVPGSYLHMLQPSATAAFAAVRRNLAREAAAQGVAARRVVWVDRMAKAAHLARHQVCDLFLDGVVYGAHSTAADALFAGLPVLALRGRNFVGRVAASLVEVAGLGILVVHTLKEFENVAVRLAGHLARSLEVAAGSGSGLSGSSERLGDSTKLSRTAGGVRLVDVWRSRLLACTGAKTLRPSGRLPSSTSHARSGVRNDSSVLGIGSDAAQQCEPTGSSLFDAQSHARDLEQVSLSMWTVAATSPEPMHVVVGRGWNRGRSVAPVCGSVMSSRIESDELWSLESDPAEPPLTGSSIGVDATPTLCARTIIAGGGSHARQGGGPGGSERARENVAGASGYHTPSRGEEAEEAAAASEHSDFDLEGSRSSLGHVLGMEQHVPATIMRDAMLVVAQELARGRGA